MTFEAFTTGQLFAFLLIFTRIGAGVMVMPGIGEAYVSARSRLIFALTFAVVLMPALAPLLPPVPASPLHLAVMLGMEITIGAFLGLMARLLVSAMHIAGMIISYQSSLSSAMMFDMTQASQGTAIGNFLSLTAVTLLFATDSQHLMLQGLFDSYTLFPAGDHIPADDMSNYFSRLMSDVFLMAFKLSAPMVVVSMVAYLGMGVLSRLMPTMQVFFIIIPPQILVSFAVLMTCLSGTFLWYLDFTEAHLNAYLGR